MNRRPMDPDEKKVLASARHLIDVWLADEPDGFAPQARALKNLRATLSSVEEGYEPGLPPVSDLPGPVSGHRPNAGWPGGPYAN